MKAIVVKPGKPGVSLTDRKAPPNRDGLVTLKPRLVGICGTDREIISAYYGQAPPGDEFLTIGHESLCSVSDPGNSGLKEGQLVVPTVRRSCGQCWSCLHGQSDMCFTGNYKERGINGLDGYNSEIVVESTEYMAPVPDGIGDFAVLTEPMTIGEKAIAQAINLQKRVDWTWDCKEGFSCKKALVLGTGPVGLLAALVAKVRGFRVWAADRHGADTERALLLKSAGVEHIDSQETSLTDFATSIGQFDLIVEATGDAAVGLDIIPSLGPNGIIALTGIPGGSQTYQMPAVQIMRSMVLKNLVVVGIVNANLSYFKEALSDMVSIEKACPGVLAKMVTHRFPPEEFAAAYSEKGADAVKVTIDWTR